MQKVEQNLQQKIKAFINAIGKKDTKFIEDKMMQFSQISQQIFNRQEGNKQLKQKVNQLMSKDKLAKYKQLQNQLQFNNKRILIIAKGKGLVSIIEMLVTAKCQNVQDNHRLFVDCLGQFAQFEDLALVVQENINLVTLRQQLYLQLLAKINIFKQTAHFEDIKSLLNEAGLPVKQNQIRKQGIKDINKQIFIGRLHQQSCLMTLHRYICGLLQRQEGYWQQGVIDAYWQPSRKAINYLYIGNTQMHNIEEPSWMMQYMQLTLNANYKYFIDFVCNEEKSEIKQLLTNHFLLGAYQCLFLPLISLRLEDDLKHLNNFLIFNFVDQIGQLQQKLLLSFNVRASLIEPLLLLFQSHSILEKTLDYQSSWFEQKIFDDFLNINYSKVNLKNLDAFNIVINFITLFQRLHKKYIQIKNAKLKETIAVFYRKQILNVVAHIKTSFDRIYNYSKFAKIDILLGFKRVQNELRNNLSQFMLTDRQLQDSIQKEYYLFLSQYFEACALQIVTPIHKKLHISLGDILQQLSCVEQSDHDKYVKGFNKIFEEWSTKIQSIGKFTQYTDTKIRIIFFTYLSATNFSPVGLNLYLKIFEPYLSYLFSEDRHRILISLVTMTRQSYNEYLESHAGVLQFLNKEESNQLEKFKIINFPV